MKNIIRNQAMEIVLGLITFLFGSLLGYFISRNRFNHEREKIIIEKTRLEATEKNLASKLAEHTHIEERYRETFENLSNKIFEEKSEKFTAINQKNLEDILNPLKEKIKDFERKVDDTYKSESTERVVLKEELKRLIELNQQVSKDAINLTRALTGDSKTQGNWGEFILEKILETSGLRKGEEYILQGENLKLVSEDGRMLRPDVVIMLPNDKHLIIDSKVSLTAYERYVNSQNEEDKDIHLKNHADSIHSHIKELCEKKYDELSGISSPDFILLFMPIEAAFSLALQVKHDLFQIAWDRKIVIVSPTTLLAVLRTVTALWNQERQTKNALEIAKHGGLMYDKFVAFVTDLEQIGRNIKSTHDCYDEAMKKLSTGKGNLIKKAEDLRTLGAKTTKKLEKKHKEEEETKEIEETNH